MPLHQDIIGNVHIASREAPKSGVLSTVSGWAGLGCASCLAAPLRIQCIRIYIGQINEAIRGAVTHKETASQISPLRRKLIVKAFLMELTTSKWEI